MEQLIGIKHQIDSVEEFLLHMETMFAELEVTQNLIKQNESEFKNWLQEIHESRKLMERV